MRERLCTEIEIQVCNVVMTEIVSNVILEYLFQMDGDCEAPLVCNISTRNEENINSPEESIFYSCILNATINDRL